MKNIYESTYQWSTNWLRTHLNCRLTPISQFLSGSIQMGTVKWDKNSFIYTIFVRFVVAPEMETMLLLLNIAHCKLWIAHCTLHIAYEWPMNASTHISEISLKGKKFNCNCANYLATKYWLDRKRFGLHTINYVRLLSCERYAIWTQIKIKSIQKKEERERNYEYMLDVGK